jgi:hypothetical protein
LGPEKDFFPRCSPMSVSTHNIGVYQL